MIILKFVVFRLDQFEGDHIPVGVQIVWLHPFDPLAGKQLANEFLSKIFWKLNSADKEKHCGGKIKGIFLFRKW